MTQGVVTQTENIMASPVVFAVKKPVAERLGWIGRDVFVADILAAAEADEITYMTTSATQSNSGAMAYLSYLYAFAGQPQVLTSEMLHDPAIVEPTTRLLQQVDRTAGASGFLGELFVQQYDAFDGMVNNESAVITANKTLIEQGKDPLYVIYPVDGLAIADWPLGYVDHGDAAKSEFFTKLQEYLLSEDVQAELLAAGRRTGLNLSAVGADPAVFNPDWGIDLERVIQPITLPPAEVILEALVLYQTEFRKPSYTVYCLDFSGSMEGEGEQELTAAMGVLLDPVQSARYFLQPAPSDVTVVLPFDHDILAEWQVDGNDPAAFQQLLGDVTDLKTRGNTDIYGCVVAALDHLAKANLEGYAPAIILMTDGESNEGQFRRSRESDGPGAARRHPRSTGSCSAMRRKTSSKRLRRRPPGVSSTGSRT